jgi:hypothetical protein
MECDVLSPVSARLGIASQVGKQERVKMSYTEYQGWDQWADKYKPVGTGETRMFETYGADLKTVLGTHPNYVWTWMQGDMSDIICAGYHLVNRLGYYVTEVPWTNEDDYCLLSNEVECECYDSETEEGKADCQQCEGYGLITKYVEPVK